MNPAATKGSVGLENLLEEFAARLEAGEAVDIAAFAGAHPDHADQLRRVLPTMLVLADLGRSASAGRAAPPSAAAAAEPAPGMLGDYRILREVGRGGMGVVYEAEQVSLGRRVALKVLPFAATMDPRQLQRFHNEARAAAGLHHTNIVPVYGVGQERGVHYYAMQFIEGRTLADFITQQRREAVGHEATTDEAAAAAPSASTQRPAGKATSVAPRDAAYFRRVAEWGIQAAEALDCAHGLGVVHRDVKPANLLVDGAGRLWVTDFGLAQVQSDARLTMTGDLVGTLRYMSPEQALAKRVVVDHRTDLYSLGATLYELLTLEPAFGGTDRQELLRQIAFEEPKAPRRLNRAIPAELETIVLKALEKNPAERYATAQELADDLRRFLEDRPIRARRAGVVQRLRKLARRHRAAVGAAAVCLLVTLVALAGSVGWALNDRAARQREAESRIVEALDTGEPRLREGNPADLALLSAAQRIEAQVSSGAVGPDMRRRAEQFLRDVQMLADLDEIRLRLAETPHTPKMPAGRHENRPGEARINARIDAETDAAMNESGRFDQAGTARRYAAAFSQYGIDVLALEPAGAAAQVRASAIHEALLAGLDGWVQARPKQNPDRARLRQVADAADDNAWRRAFREAALAEDVEKLKALAGQPEAIKQPPAVLAWIGGVLRWRLPNESAALLRQAQQRHPGDFWINYNLGNALCMCQPPHREEAIGYFRAAIAIRPSSAEAQSYLAQALFDKGDREAALTVWQQALAVDPRFLLARGALAAALHALGKHDEAIICWQQGVEADPQSQEAHYNLGIALHKKGQLDEAIAEYREAIRLGKEDANAHNYLGWALADKGQLDGAIAEFRETIRLKQDDPTAHNNLGVALERKGQRDEAIVEYREGIRLDKNDGDRHYNLGSALLNKDQLDEAIAEFREAIRLKQDDGWAHNDLGSALRNKGRLDAAIAEFREAIRIQPEEPRFHYNLGLALWHKRQLDEAIAEDREAIRLQKDLPAAHNNLGLALEDKGQLDEAIAEYREEIRLHKDFVIAHNNLGNALKANGRLDEAIAEFREAIRLDKNVPALHCYLGLALHDKGQFDDAIAEYREAVRLFKDDPEVHRDLGLALEDKGQLDEAIAEYREAIRIKVDNPDAYCNLGFALLKQGRFPDALAAFKRGHELGSKNPGWSYPSARWVREAEQFVALEGKLPKLLKGEAQPTDNAERLALAKCAYYKRLYAAATRFYTQALAAQPEVADNLETEDRYNAACDAAMAGCARGEDAAKLDDQERARLRRQALDWLRADLALRVKQAASTQPKDRAAAQEALSDWLRDTDLAGVRGDAVTKLPEAERGGWRKLWADVAATRARAAPEKKSDKK